MAKKKQNLGHMTTGRRTSFFADKMVSAIGLSGAETPEYSPAKEVTSAKTQNRPKASQTESARNERRGG